MDDDVVDTQRGEIITLRIPFDVDQFIPGRDSRLYLLSGSTVVEWHLGPEGFEMLHQVGFKSEGILHSMQPTVEVAEDGMIWLTFSSTGGGATQLILDQQGLVRSGFRYSAVTDHLVDFDPVGGTIIFCAARLSAEVMICRGYRLDASEPIWEKTYQGIGRIQSIMHDDDMLYVLLDKWELRAVQAGFP